MTVYDSLPERSPVQSSAIALGMFDGLHPGHFAVLNAPIKENGDCPACVFTFSIAHGKPESKSGRRIMSINARDSLLSNLGVQHVFQPEFTLLKDMPPEVFAKRILTDYLGAKMIFCGEDFKFGKHASGKAADLKELLPNGTEVHIIPQVKDSAGTISTTRIRELVEAGEVDAAAKLLGRPFAIDFEVEHGRKLGRTLNWPTINQPFPDGYAIPRFGVYATVTTVGDNKLSSVTNVGVKPTVGSHRILAETYIRGFSGDLYGKRIPVEFVKFIREERKFDSIEELKAQIERDNLFFWEKETHACDVAKEKLNSCDGHADE